MPTLHPMLSELPPPPAGKIGWPWTKASRALPHLMPDGRSWPRISIVTPSLNQGQFIEETIRAVLLQGYPNLEYLIIDGGSTDNSVDIIRKYEPWLSYWVSKRDRGQTYAVNKGLRMTTGELVGYINSDDYYLPHALATAAYGHQSCPTAGMIYGNAVIVDSQGRRIRFWKAKKFDLKAMLAVTNIVPQSSSFFSADALRRLGYLDERWNLIMDYELSIRVGLHFPTICLAETLSHFRDHANRKSYTELEDVTRELIHFGTTFFCAQRGRPDVAGAKNATLARYHLDLASIFVLRGQVSKALSHLSESFMLYPPIVLRNGIQAVGIIKRALLKEGRLR